MILDDDDKRAIKIISSISLFDEKTITTVFRAVMQMAGIEIRAKKDLDENDENKKCFITIPGVCKLYIDYYDSVKGNKGVITEVELEAEAKRALIAEINAVSGGEETPDLRKIKSEISDAFKISLDLE